MGAAKPKVTVKVAAKPVVSGAIKISAKPKVTVKKPTVKITLKVGGSVTNEEKPSSWIGIKKGKAEFIKAWNYMYEQQGKRGSYFNYGQDCFKELMSLRSNLACAVCDNTNEKYFMESLKLQPTDVDDIQNKCAPWLKSFSTVNNVMWYMMKYVDTVMMKNDTAANLGALTAYTAPDVAACFGSSTAKVTVKAAVKPVAKVSVAVPKVAVKVAAKTRILQALVAPKATVAVTPPKATVKVTAKPVVAVTPPKATVKVTTKPVVAGAAKVTKIPTTIVQDNWTNWRGGFNQDPVVDNVALSTAGMTDLTNNLIFGYKKGSATNEVATYAKQLIAWNNALEVMYKYAAGQTALDAWTKFKGTKGSMLFTTVATNAVS